MAIAVAGRNKQNVEVCRDTAAGINPVFYLSDNLPVDMVDSVNGNLLSLDS